MQEIQIGQVQKVNGCVVSGINHTQVSLMYSSKKKIILDWGKYESDIS